MKHNKFNIGDKVRISDGSKIENYTGSWAYSMNEYVGKVAVIARIEKYSDGRFGYRLRECHGFIFDERGLEPVPSEKKTYISIRREGNKVIARDEETGKTGVAKCSPDDAFDFMTGAKLALERLSEQYPKHKFEVGDRVIGNEAASRTYGVTKSGWVGEVVSVDEDGLFAARGQGFGKRLSVFTCLSESCFDLYDGIVPGDKVKVTSSNESITSDLIGKVTALTENNDYLTRFAFGSNCSGIMSYEYLKTTLTVIAANKDYALVTEGDNRPVYIANTRDLTRC